MELTLNDALQVLLKFSTMVHCHWVVSTNMSVWLTSVFVQGLHLLNDCSQASVSYQAWLCNGWLWLCDLDVYSKDAALRRSANPRAALFALKSYFERQTPIVLEAENALVCSQKHNMHWNCSHSIIFIRINRLKNPLGDRKEIKLPRVENCIVNRCHRKQLETDDEFLSSSIWWYSARFLKCSWF